MEAHPVDIHVGKKLRARRTLMGRSQEELGTAVGITFQQVQKYERGINRIGSSRLYEFSRLLGVNVGYFFESMEDNAILLPEQAVAGADFNGFEREGVYNKEVLSLVRSFYGISNPPVRRKILSLIKSLSSVDETDGEESIASNSNPQKAVRA